MNPPGNIDLIAAYKKLIAANKSQEARLEEYSRIVNSRGKEIEMLQAMLSEATAHRSRMDSDSSELKNLQVYLTDMQQHTAAPGFLSGDTQLRFNNTTSAKQQLQHLQLDYAFLQSQLSDLQEHLLEMNQRNIVLQQQNSRIAELESLLANSQREINLFMHSAEREGQ